MRQSSTATKYPGVSRIDAQTFRVRAKVKNPKTGKMVEIDRVLEGLTLLQAVAARAKLIAESRSDAHHAATKPTLGAYVRDCWLSAKHGNVDENSLRLYTSYLKNHILPRYGERLIDQINAREIQDWVNELKRAGYAAQTIQGVACVLRMVLDRACGQHEAPLVIWKLIELPKVPRRVRGGKTNRLSEESLALAFKVLRWKFYWWHPILLVAATTGLRYCHVAGLRWTDLTQDGTLKIQRKWNRGKVGVITAKKDAPEEVQLDPYVQGVLDDYRRRMKATRHPGLASGWMFPDKTGRPYRDAELRRIWAAAQREAGIASPCRLHGIRHTFHDITRRAGVPRSVIQAMAGHHSDAMHEHYSKVSAPETAVAGAAVIHIMTARGGRDGGGDAGGDSPQRRSENALDHVGDR